jgi:major membrane immunogen (membrane-anchored lipoprotein)
MPLTRPAATVRRAARRTLVIVAVGAASVLGLVADAAPALAAGTLTQTAPTAGSVTVAASSAFVDQLAVSGNTGGVTYVLTGGGPHLTVSASGQLATTGLLLPGVYVATGTTADTVGDRGTFTYSLTVGTIVQIAPTSGSSTVNGSSGFTDQLAVAGNDGPVTYAKTGGSASVNLSSSGAISTTGTLAAGSYPITGTTSDLNGDSGTVGYTLTVGTITQVAPLTGSSTVAGSSSFVDHLAVTGNAGPVTYAKTGGSASMAVSATGRVTTTGLLLPGAYQATGTTVDGNGDSGTFAYTLTVGTITQVTPTAGSSTVAGSASFTDQLAVTGNNGSVTYAATGGSTSVTVSASGAIGTTGTLAAGSYTVTGTTNDANSDSGTFTYTLTVVISQIAPTAGATPVSGSAHFVDQLAVTGNNGTVTYTKTGGSSSLLVSPTGAITTIGTLAVGHYTATGTTSDTNGGTGTFSYTVTVTASTITQVVPTAGSATVTLSSTFKDQLATSGNVGAVTFTKTGGGSKVTVSSSGGIGTNGTLAVGVYTATGTTTDTFGDHGTFSYILTITPGTIVQAAPMTGSVTVAASSAFTAQLAVTGNTGPVTYNLTGGSTRLTVSPSGQVATTGLLLPGAYVGTGTTSDPFGDSGTFTFTLTVGTITQSAPTTGSTSVAGSATFTVLLAVTGNDGTVTFTKTGGSGSLHVSASGAVTASSTLVAGPYSVSGTTSDLNGDSGTFTYTLQVTAASITQTGAVSGTTTVAGSARYRHQLTVTGNTGAVTFAGASAHLKVAPGGAVTTTGALPRGSYTITGTTKDHYGDHGTFRFTLVVH